MKILYIAKSKAMEIFNMENMKNFFKHFTDTYHYVSEKWVIFNHHIGSGSTNSLISMFIIAITILAITIGTANVNVMLANKEVELAKIQAEIAKEKTQRDIEIAKVRADAMIDVAEYQARQEEARAATNPYMAAAYHGTSTPVNVFIDANDSKYVIETSDGATEIAISTITVKGTKYTPSQRKLMEMAFHIGKEIGFPETVQSFLLQETLAGAYGDRIGDTNLPIGKRSYGVMQMKVATALKVLKSYPMLVTKYFPSRKKLKRIRDEELIIKLIQDDEFNIRLASLNFLIHRKASKSWAQSVVAYNTGQGAANQISEPKKHKYYGRILKRLISEVRPFNKKANLSI